MTPRRAPPECGQSAGGFRGSDGSNIRGSSGTWINLSSSTPNERVAPTMVPKLVDADVQSLGRAVHRSNTTSVGVQKVVDPQDWKRGWAGETSWRICAFKSRAAEP